MIFGSCKGGIVLEEPQISVPFPSKLLEFGGCNGAAPPCLQKFCIWWAKYAFKDTGFLGGGAKGYSNPNKDIKELTAPPPPPPHPLPPGVSGQSG